MFAALIAAPATSRNTARIAAHATTRIRVSPTDLLRRYVSIVLDKSAVASAYVDFMTGEGERLLELLDDDFFDNVSQQRGPEIWRTVGGWLRSTLSDISVDLHSVAEDDDDRVLVWITLNGSHIGSSFPFMGGRPATGNRVAWPQVHVFKLDGDRIVEHWAVRNDLRVLEAIDQRR